MDSQFGGGEDIRFARRGRAGLVTLTRPSAFNALTHGMVRALAAALAAWRDDDGIEAVVIRGEGRAFCAGGDLMAVYRGRETGEPPYDFFADEYRLNAAIAHFPKPYVALIDGIVMGGGVGVSMHGSHRVVTENAVMAMPEVGIGFFPDVGGSFILPRLKRGFGVYLGMTGARVRWGDLLGSGLATHAVASAALEAVVEAIAAGAGPDAALAEASAEPPRETPEDFLSLIGRIFDRADPSAMIEQLDAAAQHGGTAAAGARDAMLAASPTSLCVAARQLAAGAMLDIDECMVMEFRILSRMLAGHDFYEGIRAVIVDKDRKPKWRPARLAAVDPAAIEAYFAPLGRRDLVL